MDREPDWQGVVERIEEGFEREDAELLGALLRDARRSRLPLIAGPARRLLVIQGLERAERCVEAGYLELARVEFGRAVARAAGGAGDGGRGGHVRATEVVRC